ncbi:transmembrane and TPR repeat-containing protein 4 [Diaphorina citri]|uniref:Transmembrane and TPR repeat-containing protein 4 n=1 Tax=Diaphorina citri TaxID=121845 RepID=A0A3Q0J8R9_DIACI|nr:transmembrane and TPR repeat-containing protein 4 [Diaphorina citri]
MISKETGVTVLLICICIELLHNKKSMLNLLSFSTSLLLLVLIRCYIMGHEMPTFAKADNPAFPLRCYYWFSFDVTSWDMKLPFIPATNLFFYVGFVVAERILYIPSIGFCYLISYGMFLLESRLFYQNVKLSKSIMTFLIIIYSFRTLQRNNDWNSDETLYRSGIAIYELHACLDKVNICFSFELAIFIFGARSRYRDQGSTPLP